MKRMDSVHPTSDHWHPSHCAEPVNLLCRLQKENVPDRHFLGKIKRLPELGSDGRQLLLSLNYANFYVEYCFFDR